MKTPTDSSTTSCANQETVDGQATAWFARLRANNVSKAQRQAFKVWLEADPSHHKAYQNVEAFWRHPDFTEALGAAKLSGQVSNAKLSRRHWHVPAMLAMAAGILLAITVYRPSLTCWQADYCTGIGEMRTVQLADGSQITLNSDTALSVNLQSGRRDIALATGEAFFAVQRNPARPFVVASQYASVRVLGTRFLVRHGQQADTVTVLSGLVEVSGATGNPAQLRADDSIVVNAKSLGPIQQVASSARIAWIKGHALFDNVPLHEVLAELNRYRRGVVLVTNARLNTLRVSGRFDIADTDHALQSLQQTLPIRIAHVAPWLAVVY